MTLEYLLDELLSSQPDTPDERTVALQERFDIMRKFIVAGISHLHSLNRMDSGALAYEAVGLLGKLLRNGEVADGVRRMIAGYVNSRGREFIQFVSEGIITGGLLGPHHDLIATFVESLDETECLSLLGFSKPANRPRQDARKFRMIEAFIIASDAGLSEVDAKAAAYAAHGGSWNVEKDRTTARTRNGDPSNVYDVRMIEEVTPLLRDAGVLAPARRIRSGRKSAPSGT